MEQILNPTNSTPIDPPNPTFAEAVRPAAFALTLTRSQVTGLQWVAARDELWAKGGPPPVHALHRKGLVVERDGWWHLTRAGWLTLGLLKEAGMVPAAFSERAVRSVLDEEIVV